MRALFSLLPLLSLLVLSSGSTGSTTSPVSTPRLPPAPPPPRVRNWGVPLVRRPVDRLYIHHTAGEEPTVECIRQGHLHRGFRDIAYHYVVFPDGHIAPGRNPQVDGAGVWGRHSRAIEIVLVGDFTRERVTSRQWAAATDWAARWCRRYRIPVAAVRGHGEAAAPGHGSLCPGIRMEAFRQAVRHELAALP